MDNFYFGLISIGVEIARILLLAEIERQRQQKTAASTDSEAQDATAQAPAPTAQARPVYYKLTDTRESYEAGGS